MSSEPLAGQRVGVRGQGERPRCRPQGQCVWQRHRNVNVPEEEGLRRLGVWHRSLKRLQFLVMWWRNI